MQFSHTHILLDDMENSNVAMADKTLGGISEAMGQEDIQAPVTEIFNYRQAPNSERVIDRVQRTLDPRNADADFRCPVLPSFLYGKR